MKISNEEYKTVKLGDICDPKQWKTISSSELIDIGYPVYGANGVIGYYSQYNHETETLLVTCRGATCGSINICSPKSYVNGNAMALDNLDSSCYIKYLYYYLKYRKFADVISGSAQPQIIRSSIQSILIPLPSVRNQKQIAKTLDTATELLVMRKQQLAELDNLIKSVFYDMFGDPVINEKGWKIEKLSQIGSINRGVSKHRPRNDPFLLGGSHPLIQTGDVANADFIIREYSQTYSDEGLKQSKKWSSGTLCITIAANIAKTAIMGFDACFPDSIVGFESNKKTNNIFVFSWFGFFQKILEAQAPESAQKNINLKILNDLDVIVPPIHLQNKFAETVTKIEEQKALIKKAVNETQYLFNSLMSEYFEQ